MQNSAKLSNREYREVENAFLDEIEERDIDFFPIDFFAFAERSHIKTVGYSQVLNEAAEIPCDVAVIKDTLSKFEDGFVKEESNGRHIIFYNDSISIPNARMRFTLWYELGHIVLGHFDDSSKSDERKTAECNWFATFAQAPMPFVIMAEPESYHDMMDIFDISRDCASYVYNRYCHVIENPQLVKRLLNSRITKLLKFDMTEICLRRILFDKILTKGGKQAL